MVKVALGLTVAMLVMLIATVRQADAQIVNVQGQLAKPPERDGVTGQIELKIDWREGNRPPLCARCNR